MMIDVNKFMKIDIQGDPLQLMYAIYGCSSFDSGFSTKSTLQNMLYSKSIQLYKSHPVHE